MIAIKNVTIESISLNFEDVVKHLPLLTIDNNVLTEGMIIHFQIILSDTKAHLFFDYATGDYCFDNNISLCGIGQVIQSNFFKHATREKFISSDNLEFLINEIKDIQ
jgi:hypothetical protein